MVEHTFFNDIYRGKKVLVTGHTGFKGAWLTTWLLELGAKVYGISKDIPTNPAMFDVLQLEDKIEHHIADVRDYPKIAEIINAVEPDFLFHMAAQPIVSTSYKDPLETISTNVIGTANVLEVLRHASFTCSAVIITSDKCYDNVEWVWGYKETDALGGKDIYSGSKGAAEVIYKSYHHSFFKNHTSVLTTSARAGNVIGGGDWALDRIVPDSAKAWSEGKTVEIRSPNATRPWQHVLEPLSGYLQLGWQLSHNKGINGESFNFGPRSEYNHPVKELLVDLGKEWGISDPNAIYIITGNIKFHEAGLLKLNCDKAFFNFKWLPTLEYAELISFTGQWYYNYYHHNQDMYHFTVGQITEYLNLAGKRKISWAR